MAGVEASPRASWRQYVRAQDFVWLLMFAALATFGPDRTPIAMFLLAALAVFQVVESKIPVLTTGPGNVISILVKLALGYMLIGYTDGVASSYYFILLL